jgi:AIPR protein
MTAAAQTPKSRGRRGRPAQALLRSLVARTGFLRDALHALASRHPTVEIHVVYDSRGSVADLHSKVVIKGKQLEAQSAGVMPGATGVVDFMGAAELWRSANELPSYTTQLTYQENATSGNSHVALVRLSDYVDFLAGDEGNLRRHIFDWNVSDFQGDVERCHRCVLQGFGHRKDPLLGRSSGRKRLADFACHLHGVARRSRGSSGAGSIRPCPYSCDGDDAATRDRVIRATNRKTSVSQASLRVTDDIQRDVEAFFYGHDWYYDRRKNYYRNNGNSAERIVSISLLAQAVMAMGLSRPDDSRARPSCLLKRDEDYAKLFPSSIPIGIYLWLAESQKSVDAFLASEAAGVTTQERTNLRFHVAMVAAAKLVGAPVTKPDQLESIATARTPITDADLPACLDAVPHCGFRCWS